MRGTGYYYTLRVVHAFLPLFLFPHPILERRGKQLWENAKCSIPEIE
jgi:hypothetical protein